MPPTPVPVDDNSESMDIPDQFICPISLEIMRDPVMSRRGQNYDRHSILQWFRQGNHNCPLTRQPLSPSQLVPNNALKLSIHRWKAEQGLKDEEPSDNISLHSLIPLYAEIDVSKLQPVGNDIHDLAYLRDIYDDILEIVGSVE